jgi:hypothetical protein
VNVAWPVRIFVVHLRLVVFARGPETRRQVRQRTFHEPPIVTSGDCINEISRLLDGRDDYSAADVIAHLAPGCP